jgi:hypothetical protein
MMKKPKVRIVKKVVVKQVVGKAQFMVLKRLIRVASMVHGLSLAESEWKLAGHGITTLTNAKHAVVHFRNMDKAWGVEYEYRIYKCERVH